VIFELARDEEFVGGAGERKEAGEGGIEFGFGEMPEELFNEKRIENFLAAFDSGTGGGEQEVYAPGVVTIFAPENESGFFKTIDGEAHG
jgi:hypothetical protein